MLTVRARSAALNSKDTTPWAATVRRICLLVTATSETCDLVEQITHGSASKVRVGSVRIDGEDVPVARDALERVNAAVRELQSGPGHQILDRVGHQHLA